MEKEDKRKREIEEAETLIAESAREIREAGQQEDTGMPQLKATDISQLFGEEEKNIFAASRGVSRTAAAEEATPSLEKTAEEEAESETAGRGREETKKKIAYGSVMEQAKSGMKDVYQSGRSVTGKEGEHEDVYQRRSVTGEGDGHEDVYQSQSVSGVTYHRNEAEEKTRGNYQ